MDKLTLSETRILRSLSTPAKIQKFLDNEVAYHSADTAYSPRLVLRHREAHCLEGAVLAAAALRMHGHPPLILDLEATHDTDHVIAIFRQHGAWGAIAMSNYTGLRFRPPVYRNLRELALSYFNDYFNLRRERTLRNFSGAVNLSRFDRRGWVSREDNIWFIAEHLCDIPHTPLITPRMEKGLTPIDHRALGAGKFGMVAEK